MFVTVKNIINLFELMCLNSLWLIVYLTMMIWDDICMTYISCLLKGLNEDFPAKNCSLPLALLEDDPDYL